MYRKQCFLISILLILMLGTIGIPSVLANNGNGITLDGAIIEPEYIRVVSVYKPDFIFAVEYYFDCENMKLYIGIYSYLPALSGDQITLAWDWTGDGLDSEDAYIEYVVDRPLLDPPIPEKIHRLKTDSCWGDYISGFPDGVEGIAGQWPDHDPILYHRTWEFCIDYSDYARSLPAPPGIITFKLAIGVGNTYITSPIWIEYPDSVDWCDSTDWLTIELMCPAFVIPEMPFGTIAAFTASAIAFVILLGHKRHTI